MMAGKKGAAFFPRSTSGRDSASLEAIERARYWLRVSEFLIGETYAWSELIEKSTDRQLRHSIAERIEHMRASGCSDVAVRLRVDAVMRSAR